MKVPHILLAAKNVVGMRNNLVQVLDKNALQAIDDEISSNVANIYHFGLDYYNFAIRQKQWRQCISRLYYAAYNMGRSVRLANDGSFFQDSSDHNKLRDLPDKFQNVATYEIQLPLLRQDRNLCDYDHSSVETDLAISVRDSKLLVNNFKDDCKAFLLAKGVHL